MVILKGHKNIEWTYFIPFKNGTGVFYLPAYYIFPIYLMTDFVELIKSPFGSTGSIALNAHVGGALFGLFAGFCYLVYQKISKKYSALMDMN